MNCKSALLTEEALLHISGPDALTFLQGQVTCDTRLLDRHAALPGVYCSPKGRVICDFLLSQLGEDHVALRLRRDIRAQTAAVLGKYIVFSKAELDAGRDDWQAFALWGEDAAERISTLCGSTPQKRFGAVSSDGIIIVQMDEAGLQFEGYLDKSQHARLPPPLAEVISESGSSEWKVLQILAGQGRIESATMEAFVPQMLNYDLTGHISFSKGCYTGQEVVARLHYRGTPKRRMYLARFDVGTTAQPGTELYRPDSGQSVGTLVNCAPTGEGQAAALAICTTEAAGGELRMESPQGQVIKLENPPYSLEKD